MTTDTPRTDSCPHCGSQTEVDSFFRTTCGNLLDYREGNIGKIAGERTDLCHEIEVSNLWRKRAEKAEAEVERLTKRPFGCKCETFREKALGDGCEECNKALVIEMLTDERDELDAEVDRLKKELDAWDYGTRAKREQTRAEKAEANLRRAIEIADVLRSGGSRACRELHHPKRDQHEYAEVCPVEERLEKASEELDGLKATLNQAKK
jgi:hypothetical protein